MVQAIQNLCVYKVNHNTVLWYNIWSVDNPVEVFSEHQSFKLEAHLGWTSDCLRVKLKKFVHC